MTVRELIAALQKMPPNLDATIWDDEADDWLPVVQVLFEDGTTMVTLLTATVETVEVCPSEDGEPCRWRDCPEHGRGRTP